ncbi:sensor domain-containing diguanylate cyclase [Neobacillus bataviensis]|uniref:sensor domain-containing diguanylate cyclase n=1 Tax=Neobacillus bataviensis TaxID=220685 RepID=UPI001CBFA1DD|nr:sensor domain-containing diguanylate cyclase [Neobacillus bataviensis]
MNILERELILQSERYKKLFRISEKLHSTFDIDTLLGELFVILQEVYPDFSYNLLMSQDTYIHNELPILELEYDNENMAAIEAYVTAEKQYEQSDSHTIIYEPIKGIQGIYGVLQVFVPYECEFLKTEVEFITLLAGSVGQSLENALLYQQSRRRISNLKLINETSHRLNSNLRLAETIGYITEQIKSSFNAQEVGFFILSEEHEKVKVLPGSTPYFFTKQARFYVKYIKEKIQMEKESLFMGDMSLPKIQTITNFHSVMAVPMIQAENLKGFTIVMHQKPYFFSFETFKLLQSLIHHSSLALTNSLLREELEKLVITDHLTKLHSRKYLDEQIQWSMKEDEEGTFILIDIDNFKEINDLHGHQVGDEVLIQVANVIMSNIRGNDIGARWGGEELAIYLPKVALDAGVRIAKRLVEKVAESTNPHITVSCGVSYWHKERLDTYNHLFKRADEALYHAKGTGKNKVVSQNENMKVS